jgi:hypothetical protein
MMMELIIKLEGLFSSSKTFPRHIAVKSLNHFTPNRKSSTLAPHANAGV